MPTVFFTDDGSDTTSCSPLKIQQQKVSMAYFAVRKEKEVIVLDPNSDEEVVIDHVTTSGQIPSVIAKLHGVEESKLKRTKKGKHLFIGEIIKVTKKGSKKKEVSFKKVNEAKLNDDIFIIVETEHLREEKLIIEILQGDEDVLVKKDQAITVLQDGNYTSCIETIVGAYCDEEEISNKDDFADWGIAKIKLKPEDDVKKKEWEDGLNCVSSKKALLYLYIDAHGENSIPNFESKYILYEGFKGSTDDSVIPNHFLNEDNEWFSLKRSGIIDIYHTGEISEIDLDSLEKVSYVYHDKKGNEHDFGEFDVVKADKWKSCSKTVKTGWKKVTAGGKNRWYQYGEGKVPLIKVKLPISYNKNDVKVYLKDNTSREYMNPEAYACFIGALAENGYEDVTFNGFTSEDGTGAPSVTHYNGIAGDLRYLRKDKKITSLHINDDPDELDVERQEKLIDAFVKFGWNSFLSYNITIDEEAFILKKSTHMSHHHHHLHLNKGDFKIDYKK